MFQAEFKKIIKVIDRKILLQLFGAVLIIGIIIGIFISKAILKCPIIKENSNTIHEQSLEIIEPEDSVNIVDEEANLVCVDVSGAVNSRYFEQNINSATKLFAGAKIYIPYKEDVLCKLKETEESLFVGGKDLVVNEDVSDELDNLVEKKINNSDGDNVIVDSDCVDLNTSTLAELDDLVGIGPSTAQSIIDARPFQAIDELLNVSGIGQSKFDAINEFVCVL